jgi:hypothetical protein
MKIPTMCVSLGILASLSACGGSGTSGGPSFSSLSSTGQSILSQYGSAPTTDVANMPQSGTATYRGVAAYSGDSSDPAYLAAHAQTLSQLELNADFGTSSISGRAYNFKTIRPGASVNGQIDINGTITGNTINATLTGSTQESFESIQDYTVNYSGNVQGEFVGSGAEAIRGTGSAIGDAGILGSATIYTLWGAER